MPKLAQTGYSAGTYFSLSDINVMPMLHYLRELPEGGEVIKRNKHLNAHDERLVERACFKATIPPHPPGRDA